MCNIDCNACEMTNRNIPYPAAMIIENHLMLPQWFDDHTM